MLPMLTPIIAAWIVHALSEGALSPRAFSGTMPALGLAALLNITLAEQCSGGVPRYARTYPALPDRWNPSGEIFRRAIRFQQCRRPVILKDALRVKRIADSAESIEPGIEGCYLVGLERAHLPPVRARMEQF